MPPHRRAWYSETWRRQTSSSRERGSKKAALQRSPEAILAEYDLNDDERSTVLQALARLAQMPAAQRDHALRTALIRRVAT